MSDKVTKIRVNGVEKEVGGSGGGNFVGHYLFPNLVLSAEKLGFDNATIDITGLRVALTTAGVNLSDPFIRADDPSVELVISPGTVYNSPVISIFTGADSSNVYAALQLNFEGQGNFVTVAEAFLDLSTNYSLYQVLTALGEGMRSNYAYPMHMGNMYFWENAHSNTIYIYRENINDYEFYTIPDVENFFNTCLVEASVSSS